MREREVVQQVAERLRAEGAMQLVVRYGHEPGPDVEGRLLRSLRRFFIEAKGEPNSSRKSVDRRIYLGEALLQSLSVYDADVVCALALPYTSGYERLVRQIEPGLRRLGLHVLLARNAEVWHLAPDAGGFFPTMPQLPTEGLNR